MNVCPACYGERATRQGLLAHSCQRCGGSGEVSAEQLSWMDRGRRQREQRTATGLNIIDEAERRGVPPAQVQAEEGGYVEPLWGRP